MSHGTKLHAITREVPRSIANCELTHIAREPIDVERARRQHDAYEKALALAGCVVERLPEEPALPDSVFVEDTALVLDEVAIVLRPGAASRRPETPSVARRLRSRIETVEMTGPGAIDGGDILRLGRRLFVGLSTRSDEAGIAELRALVAPRGYEVAGVPLRGCLHLKSAVSALGDDVVLVNPAWVAVDAFGAAEAIEIDPTEPFAANTLGVGGRLVFPANCPATAMKLATRGYELLPVDLSELAKAEGAVTCCSLIVRA
jgi:dimethylargininase